MNLKTIAAYTFWLFLVYFFTPIIAELLCPHTIPDINGLVLLSYKDQFYCCGCNEGEYVAEICQGKYYENTTVCQPCPFDDTNPANQSYMIQGPHLNEECLNSLQFCPTGQNRVVGNRCFPARCMPASEAADYKSYDCRKIIETPQDVFETPQYIGEDSFPWLQYPWNIVVTVVLSVVLFISIVLNVCQCFYLRRRATKHDLEAVNKPEGNTETTKKFSNRPQSDASLGDSTKTLVSMKTGDKVLTEEQVPLKCFSPTPLPEQEFGCTEVKPCGGDREWNKSLVFDIKLKISEIIGTEDGIKFSRQFGASTDDLNNNEKHKIVQSDWFVRMFEICEKSKQGKKISPENILNFFKENNAPDIEEAVQKVMESY